MKRLQYSTRQKILQAGAGITAAVALFAAWPGADAMENEKWKMENEPKAVGYLIIPGILREAKAEELEPVRIMRPDNERVLEGKLARWEARRAAADPKPEKEPEREYLGRYWITGYTISYADCGKIDGITASGVQAEVGRTCAAGRDLPFGTTLWIEGIGTRVVEDRGGGVRSGHIDVLFGTRAECYAATGYYDVYREVQP